MLPLSVLLLTYFLHLVGTDYIAAASVRRKFHHIKVKFSQVPGLTGIVGSCVSSVNLLCFLIVRVWSYIVVNSVFNFSYLLTLVVVNCTNCS